LSNDLVEAYTETTKAVAATAAAGAKAIDALMRAGGYLSQILGDVPKDLVGYFGGDELRYRRAVNLEQIAERARRRQLANGTQPSEPVRLPVALPLLAAAAEESDPTLQEMWAGLLASAMDPKIRDSVRQQFIATAKELSPVDVKILLRLKTIERPDPQTEVENTYSLIANALGLTIDTTSVSYEALRDLKLAINHGTNQNRLILTAKGREFLLACGE
jgi:hypothetical protein